MATKNNQRTRITKMLLKNSLISLLNEKPINHISIKEICETAELNRSTFYLHYSDQHSLLKDIQSEISDNTKIYLKDMDSSSDSLAYLQSFLEYIKSNSEIFNILLCKQENTNFQTKFITETMESIKINISFSCPQESEKYVYSFLMQGSMHIIKQWIQSNFDITSKQVASLIFELCSHSISSMSN